MKRILLLTLIISACLTKTYSQTYVPKQNDSRFKIKPKVDVRAYAFELGAVQLLESTFKQAEEVSVKYLLQLEPDRLLSQFRSHAGLKAKANRYGGWESEGLAGHSLGHYLSGCAIHYAISKDDEFLKRVNYIVDELFECQQARGTGYVGAVPREDSVFLEVSKGNITSRGFDLNGAWSPWYTIHKVMSGLLDAYLYCGNAKALQVEQEMADWAHNVLKDLNEKQIQKMLLCEYGGMNDVLANTYAITGDKKYLDLSYKFHDRRILDSLAVGIDVLPGKHSNTQVPKAIGTARRYQITANQSDYAIAKFFWETMVSHHTYAPGGNSNYEYLSTQDELSGKLTDNTMETCNTHNMLKLTRHLFALEPTSKYYDYYERALYNHILASQNHQNGMTCYFVPLRMGTKKEFSDEFNTFTCCVGTGMENHVKYETAIYSMGKENDIYVNLFIPSTLSWKEKRTILTLNSNLPVDPNVIIEISPERAQVLTLHVRKPYWAGNPRITVNNKKVDSKIEENGYITISRKWKKGDKLQFTLQSTLHTMSMPDNPSRKAFFYGPVLLAGNLGTVEPDPMNGTPVLVTNDKDISKWITRDKNTLEFKTTATGKPDDVSLQPFYNFDDEYYSVYFDVFTPAQWVKEQAAYEERKKAELELEKSTVDIIRLGEMQPERDHEFAGEKTEAGENHTRKYRVARRGGEFSFKMKVTPGFSHILIGTYWGMDNRGRTFDVIVDDEVIATENLNKYKDSKFYDIQYRIPTDLLKGKTRITVSFKPKPGNQAGPVYGVRLVKEAKTEQD